MDRSTFGLKIPRIWSYEDIFPTEEYMQNQDSWSFIDNYGL